MTKKQHKSKKLPKISNENWMILDAAIFAAGMKAAEAQLKIFKTIEKQRYPEKRKHD